MILSGCGGTLVEVKLSDLNSGLRKYEGDTIYDNVTNNISYKTYDNAKYDEIFRESALTKATVDQIRFSLERVIGDSVSFPKNAKSKKFGIEMVKMAKKQVQELPTRVIKVTKGVASLSPKSDFSGMSKSKIPQVLISLKDAALQMKDAGEGVVEIGKLLKKAVKDKLKDPKSLSLPGSTENPTQDSDPIASAPVTKSAKIYREVTIGTQTWMAENLNVASGNSWCYNNQEANCKMYGRLYDWQTATSACPQGWHLPSNKDWKALEKFSGLLPDADLEEESGDAGKGDFGFSALPGGYYVGPAFSNIGVHGYWWSATEDDAIYASIRHLGPNGTNIGRYNYDKSYGFSVRCLKNSP
jgi:uncharacterized protein (TIGR02145 family)